jgi:hypothetical protein
MVVMVVIAPAFPLIGGIGGVGGGERYGGGSRARVTFGYGLESCAGEFNTHPYSF